MRHRVVTAARMAAAAAIRAMVDVLQATVVDALRATAAGALRALAAVIQRRAATAVGDLHTAAAGRMVAAEGTVDMGGRIALDCFPA